MLTCDVLIVGGGAAGLSAALVLSRARRAVVVVDAGQPRNAPAAHMHGFLGSDGLPPADLLAAGRREILGYGASILPGTVTSVTLDRTERGEPRFDVTVDGGRTISARRLLVSTGLHDDIPAIPGLRERWGRDVLHCPYCHGFEVSDQPLGVIGGTREAVVHTQIVRQWSEDVVHFANGTTVSDVDRERLLARGILVVDDRVVELVIERDRLTGVRLETGEVVPRVAVFVRPRFVPNSGLLTQLGCEIGADGWATTDQTGRTSVPGAWAAGNSVNPRAQVITAAGEGSAAAIAINNDLVEEDVATATVEARSTR